jgi:hypothetical protein
MVPAAELRVYQPLTSLPVEEQARWERFIVAGAPGAPIPRYEDVATPAGLGFLCASDSDGAYVKVLEGDYYVCPSRTRMRVLAGLLAFNEAEPFDHARAFVPSGVVKRATRELRRLRRRNPGHVASIMQSPWHVPVRWFVLFEDEERRLHERDGRNRLSYLTTVRRAIRRIERAVPVLRHSELGSIADLIVDLHRWLSTFDPNALLELDYGGLCDLMSWDDMDDDHSAREIHEALRALANEEFPRSADLYQAALSRSAELRNHESTN